VALQTRTELATTTSTAQRSQADKNLIFSLGTEEFGIQVLHIKEIIGMQEITAVPNMPPHIKGVINLRGQVIPVVDLSLKFAFAPREYTDRTCIVVVRSQNNGRERLIGAIADGVTEVLTIAAEDIEQSPDFGSGAPVPYLLGMAKVRGKVKLLLDTTQVFSTEVMLKLGND
jgi:purine-binding chemotaxis protein CheW